MLRTGVISCCLTLLLVCGSPAILLASHASPTALAYVGPGAGLGMLGSLLAVLAAVVIGLLGLVLYPFMLLRKMLRKRSAAKVAATEE